MGKYFKSFDLHWKYLMRSNLITKIFIFFCSYLGRLYLFTWQSRRWQPNEWGGHKERKRLKKMNFMEYTAQCPTVTKPYTDENSCVTRRGDSSSAHAFAYFAFEKVQFWIWVYVVINTNKCLMCVLVNFGFYNYKECEH